MNAVVAPDSDAASLKGVSRPCEVVRLFFDEGRAGPVENADLRGNGRVSGRGTHVGDENGIVVTCSGDIIHCDAGQVIVGSG